jgi:hypothetical protein
MSLRGLGGVSSIMTSDNKNDPFMVPSKVLLQLFRRCPQHHQSHAESVVLPWLKVY